MIFLILKGTLSREPLSTQGSDGQWQGAGKEGQHSASALLVRLHT